MENDIRFGAIRAAQAPFRAEPFSAPRLQIPRAATLDGRTHSIRSNQRTSLYSYFVLSPMRSIPEYNWESQNYIDPLIIRLGWTWGLRVVGHKHGASLKRQSVPIP